jgi:hypothetical protein
MLKEAYIDENFFTMLKLIFYIIDKQISLQKYSKMMIENLTFLKDIRKISFSKYGPLTCNMRIIYGVLGLPGFDCNYLG